MATCRRPSWPPRPDKLSALPPFLGCRRPEQETTLGQQCARPRSVWRLANTAGLGLLTPFPVASYQEMWGPTRFCFWKPDHTKLCFSLCKPAQRAGRWSRCPETVNRASLKAVRGPVGGSHVTGSWHRVDRKCLLCLPSCGDVRAAAEAHPSAAPRDPHAMPWGTRAGRGWFSDPHGSLASNR